MYDLVLVSEYPKSGASWLAQMLAEYLRIPFRRNTSARFEKAVMHGHYLIQPGFNKPICVVRDGRDIMVSYYFHMLVGNDRMPDFSVHRARQRLPLTDYTDIRANLPRFIKYLHSSYIEQKGYMYFSLEQFLESAHENKALVVKYENLKRDCSAELCRAIRHVSDHPIDMARIEIIVNKYSFQAQTGRTEGKEDKDSYLRKGIVGDWRNHFSREAREVFHKYAGNHLIQLGYEKDSEWVSEEAGN